MQLDERMRANFLDIITPFLVVAIFAGVFVSAYTYYIRNEIERYLPGGVAHEASIALKVEQREAYLAQIEGLNVLYEKFAHDPEEPVSLILPPKKDIASLFANYESLTHNLGMEMQSISVSDEVSKKQTGIVKEVPFSIKIANVDYLRLKRILSEIESDARLVDVVSFDFDPTGQSLGINAKVYYGGKQWKSVLPPIVKKLPPVSENPSEVTPQEQSIKTETAPAGSEGGAIPTTVSETPPPPTPTIK